MSSKFLNVLYGSLMFHTQIMLYCLIIIIQDLYSIVFLGVIMIKSTKRCLFLAISSDLLFCFSAVSNIFCFEPHLCQEKKLNYRIVSYLLRSISKF